MLDDDRGETTKSRHMRFCVAGPLFYVRFRTVRAAVAALELTLTGGGAI
jgi:hypothetical protein